MGSGSEGLWSIEWERNINKGGVDGDYIPSHRLISLFPYERESDELRDWLEQPQVPERLGR
jgi:hypothetical protein